MAHGKEMASMKKHICTQTKIKGKRAKSKPSAQRAFVILLASTRDINIEWFLILVFLYYTYGEY